MRSSAFQLHRIQDYAVTVDAMSQNFADTAQLVGAQTSKKVNWLAPLELYLTVNTEARQNQKRGRRLRGPLKRVRNQVAPNVVCDR